MYDETKLAHFFFFFLKMSLHTFVQFKQNIEKKKGSDYFASVSNWLWPGPKLHWYFYLVTKAKIIVFDFDFVTTSIV